MHSIPTVLEAKCVCLLCNTMQQFGISHPTQPVLVTLMAIYAVHNVRSRVKHHIGKKAGNTTYRQVCPPHLQWKITGYFAVSKIRSRAAHLGLGGKSALYIIKL